MNVRSFVVKNYHHQNIVLGRKGEFCVERVDFILNELIADYGEGTADVVFVPPNSKEEYPVVMTRNGNTVEWTITESIVAIDGEGVARVYFYPTEGGRKISCDFYCKVLAGATEARDPDYLADYVHHAENIKEDATREADRAEREANRAKEEANRAEREADRAERAVGVVRSVNGKTGEVVLSASDVGALPDTTKFITDVALDAYADKEKAYIRYYLYQNGKSMPMQKATIPVVDGSKAGVMTPSMFNQLGMALMRYSKPSTGIPLKDLAEDVKDSLAKADTSLQNVPEGYLTEEKGKEIFPLKEDLTELSKTVLGYFNELKELIQSGAEPSVIVAKLDQAILDVAKLG